MSRNTLQVIQRLEAMIEGADENIIEIEQYEAICRFCNAAQEFPLADR